jgi:hypothetical protein
MKKIFITLAAGAVALGTHAQVLLSGGLSYSQNFDSLSNSPAASSGPWTDNATPGMTGWFASRAYVSGTTSAFGPFAYTAYRIGDGSANNGTIWSFGTIGSTDRALGSLSSGTPKTNVWGVWIKNDTANVVNSLTVGYTGEQWRDGGNTTLALQKLDFSYQTSASGFASPIGVDSAPNGGWTAFSALNFTSPNIVSTTGVATDGNLAANRTVFGPTVLTGVSLNPGDSIFIRWLDIDDSGNDHGLAVDDFSFSAFAVPEPSAAALMGLASFGLICWRRIRR